MIKVHELSDDFRWVAVNNYTENDYHQLVSEEHVTDEMLGYATDQHERGRLEYDAKSAITTIILTWSQKTLRKVLIPPKSVSC